jgi:hypothetical protein
MKGALSKDLNTKTAERVCSDVTAAEQWCVRMDSNHRWGDFKAPASAAGLLTHFCDCGRTRTLNNPTRTRTVCPIALRRRIFTFRRVIVF